MFTGRHARRFKAIAISQKFRNSFINHSSRPFFASSGYIAWGVFSGYEGGVRWKRASARSMPGGGRWKIACERDSTRRVCEIAASHASSPKDMHMYTYTHARTHTHYRGKWINLKGSAKTSHSLCLYTRKITCANSQVSRTRLSIHPNFVRRSSPSLCTFRSKNIFLQIS